MNKPLFYMLLLNESCSLNTASEHCTSICSFISWQYLWRHLAKSLMIADVRIAPHMLHCWSASENNAGCKLFSLCKQTKSCCVTLPHMEDCLVYHLDPSSYHRSSNVAALLVWTSEVPAGCQLRSKALLNYLSMDLRFKRFLSVEVGPIVMCRDRHWHQIWTEGLVEQQ